MTLFFKSYKNLYKDSVSLMQMTASLASESKINNLSIAMQTEANIERAKASGINLSLLPSPNDLMVVFNADDKKIADQIFSLIDSKLNNQETETTDQKKEKTFTSILQAKEAKPKLNLALISVPGAFAAAEALKALKANLNVMIFSDNVSEEDELLLKQEATSRKLLVMGPDCGTCVINGYPLGFANILMRGDIGLVGASGTGLQEVSCAISNRGCGVSQVIGTGGRDLHEKIGGLSMLFALDLLNQDPNTKIICVISKPPALTVKEKIIAKLKSFKKPCVVHFLGESNKQQRDENIYYEDSLIECANSCCLLSLGEKNIEKQTSYVISCKNKPSGFIRGIFCGGTFCAEMQNVALKAGLSLSSNVPIPGVPSLPKDQPLENAFIDMGDDEFTNGKPHPMIDPTQRDMAILKHAKDRNVKVIVFDVVLGIGSNQAPIENLLNIIKTVKRPDLNFICHVCGTNEDPQNRQGIINSLTKLGVKVAKSNYEAAIMAINNI